MFAKKFLSIVGLLFVTSAVNAAASVLPSCGTSFTYTAVAEPSTPGFYCLGNNNIIYGLASSDATQYDAELKADGTIYVFEVESATSVARKVLASESITAARENDLALYRCDDTSCVQTFGYIKDSSSNYYKVTTTGSDDVTIPTTKSGNGDTLESGTDCTGYIGGLIDYSGKYLCIDTAKSIEFGTDTGDYVMGNIASNIFTGGADNNDKSIVLESQTNSITLKPVGDSINIYTKTSSKITGSSTLSAISTGTADFAILNCNEKNLCLSSNNGFVKKDADTWFTLSGDTLSELAAGTQYDSGSCDDTKIGKINSSSKKLCLGVTEGETYVLTTSAPMDWSTSTNCHAYYKKVGSAYVAESGDCSTVAWAADTYYEKKNAGTVALEVETTSVGVIKDYIMKNVASNVFMGDVDNTKYIVVRAHPDGFTWNNNLPASGAANEYCVTDTTNLFMGRYENYCAGESCDSYYTCDSNQLCTKSAAVCAPAECTNLSTAIAACEPGYYLVLDGTEGAAKTLETGTSNTNGHLFLCTGVKGSVTCTEQTKKIGYYINAGHTTNNIIQCEDTTTTCKLVAVGDGAEGTNAGELKRVSDVISICLKSGKHIALSGANSGEYFMDVSTYASNIFGYFSGKDYFSAIEVTDKSVTLVDKVDHPLKYRYTNADQKIGTKATCSAMCTPGSVISEYKVACDTVNTSNNYYKENGTKTRA